jgi:hypothetical protein
MAELSKKSTYNPDVDPVATYARKVKPNKTFYDRVIATKTDGTRTLVYEDVLEPHTGNAFFVKASQLIRMEQRPSLHNGRNQIADVLFVTTDLEQISDHLNNSALEGLHLRLYGVYDEAAGVGIRGRFIIDPDGVIQAKEVLTPPVGRNVAELIRQVQAFQLVRETKGAEATPSGWQPGRTTLKVGPDLVGKVWKVWTTDQAFQDFLPVDSKPARLLR